jgi:hypothetical protein
LQYKQEILRREGGVEIYRRTIDRRSGPMPIMAGSGESKCIWRELMNDTNLPEGDVPGLDTELAGGTAIMEDGLEMVKQALWFDRKRPFDPLYNSPKLFVSKACTQTLWAFQHFTGRDGNLGACKDPIDCIRDMMTSGLEYMMPGAQVSIGGGSY